LQEERRRSFSALGIVITTEQKFGKRPFFFYDGRTNFLASRNVDPAFKRVVYFLLAGSRGGINRIQILRHLKEDPVNANKLATDLKLDYKTILHHLKVLEQHGLVASSDKGAYGNVYFLSPYFETQYSILEEIWVKVNKISGDKK
jgi:DNA-binding transcriptional ArsR family regulator